MRLPILLLLSASLAWPGLATAAEPSEFAGHYELEAGDKNEVAMEAAIEKVVLAMPFIFRAIARQKIRNVARFPPTFIMSYGEGRMTIASDVTDKEEGWTTDLARNPLEIAGHRGEPIRIQRWMEDGQLHSLGSSQRGTHKNVFRLEEEGRRMVLSVTISNQRLSQPLSFEVHYLRVE
ncbi:MAG: hypothetical protein VX498_13290 [Myxococcota bacterium]|nr:hypothetical protein [Myxococcota bacterium]